MFCANAFPSRKYPTRKRRCIQLGKQMKMPHDVWSLVHPFLDKPEALALRRVEKSAVFGIASTLLPTVSHMLSRCNDITEDAILFIVGVERGDHSVYRAMQCMPHICRHGNVNLARAIEQTFFALQMDARFANSCLIEAIDGSHRGVCDWLVANYGDMLRKSPQVCMAALATAAGLGDLDLCEWWGETFGTVSRVGLVDSPMIAACENGHLHVCEWLLSKFPATAEPTVIMTAFHRTASKGHTHVCQRDLSTNT